MVDIEELKDGDDEVLMSDDLATAKANPAAGWVVLVKRFREEGNGYAATKDWENAVKAYKMATNNIDMLLVKNIGDEDEPYVVKKEKEEIEKEGLYTDELRALHLALVKNISLAHTQMNELGCAIDAAEIALEIDPTDPKALYRKAYALQVRGSDTDIVEVKKILKIMEQLDLKEGSKEAKEVKQGIAKIRKISVRGKEKSKAFQKNMVSALKSKPGAISEERMEKDKKNYSTKLKPEERYRRNGEILSTEQAFKIVDKLADGYQSDMIQGKINHFLKHRSNDPEDSEFRLKLADIAMIVQRPILEEYGFEPNKKGLTEMLSALYQHEDDEDEEGRELKPLLGIAFSSLLSASWKAQGM